MSKSKELILLILSDFVFINLAYSVYYFLRVETGWIIYANPPSYLTPMLVIYSYWFILFLIFGLYQHWFVRSRFDEFISIVKTVFVGCLILFFAIFIDDFIKDAKVISRFLILIYWFIMILFVSFGRIFIRSFQMQLLQKGIGVRNTIIVGSGKNAYELHEMIQKYPKLGYKFIGYIGLHNENNSENEIGKITDLKNIIRKEKIEVVLVASEQKAKNVLLDTLNYCADENVAVKIMPELYEIISGMAKTQQIYGLPLIEVKTELISVPSKIIKRLIDIFISLFVLLILSPFLIITAILIKLTSKGPIFYTQKRLGKSGKLFKVIKFRSMVQNAESESGPTWADLDDPRVTAIGRFMRRIRLDEVPQFINVLKNDMSIVGPRPERPFFVEQLKKEIPYYSRRLSVKPGITGWAQVKHTYDMSIEDVKTKLQYDFYYIENMSLSLDFRIMANTLLVVFTMKGH
ncbi:MAG: sugar transferase [Ignavibacteriae bacterium]|nr:sugar transferase [Ignavibacteriota bacterium]